MKKIFFLLIISLILFAGCSNNETPSENTDKKELPREQFVEEIKKLETEMFKSKVVVPEIANKAIKAYSDYALFFPKDSITPHYLFKAGEIATANHQYAQAIAYYENIEKEHKTFIHADAAVYMQAYIYDYLTNEDAKAKDIYERLISNFPKSIYVNDAQSAIKNLGKSDEQLIEEFKKKNGQK